MRDAEIEKEGDGPSFFCIEVIFLEQRHVPRSNVLPLRQPEDHDGQDEYGVFPEAAGAAYLEGEAFLCEGYERRAVRGAHVQQAMRERPEAKAVDERGG